MRLIDTHNHLDFPNFDVDRATLLRRSRALRIECQVVLDVYRENRQWVRDLAQARDGLYTALSLHPVYLARYRSQYLDDLRQWLQHLRDETKLYAVGEIGPDYYLEYFDRDAQQALFEAQLRSAAEFRLPVLIRACRAHAATTAILKRIRLERHGIIHALAGSREEACEYLRLDFRLGLGGTLTWPQASRLRKVTAELSTDAIVLGADTSGIAPPVHPGRRDSPGHLPDTCYVLTELCGIDAEELAASSSRNAVELSGWG